MTESNPVQVTLSDDGLKIINVQNTADKVASRVTNLNDPNSMSVIEKQSNIVQFAGLTSQYNVLIQNAKDDGIDTTAVTTAYNNLNQFMASVLADPDHASDVDRAAYKKYQDAYNEALSNLQNALQNNADSQFASAAAAASQAAVATSQAKSAAESAYNYANSEIAVQSNATAKAQSTADSAFSQAKTAIDNGNVTSQAVTVLKDGSTMTIAQLQNGLATKVSNSEYASYTEQTASQIGDMVTNGAFSAYQQTTADLISAKVATKDFSAYQATTAKAIESKVESSDFNTYKTQTADMISSKVSTIDFDKLTISNRNLALGTANPITAAGTNIDNQLTSGYGFSDVIPNGTVVTVTFDITSSTGVGNFVMQFSGNDSGSDWQTISVGSLVNGTKHVSATVTTDSNHLGVYPRINFATGTVTISNFIISESSKEVSWTPAPEDQATQSQITQLKDNIDLRVSKNGLIDEINQQAGKTLISSSGQLTLSGKNINFDTDNPVIIPSANINSLLVNKKLTAADISANTFSTNNGTFTVDQNGAVVANSITIRGATNLVYNAALLGGSGSSIPGWGLNGEPYYDNSVLFDGVPAIAWNGDATGRWDNYANSKLQPVTQTGIPYSASIKFRDYGSASGMLYTFTIAFFIDNNASARISNTDYAYTANGSDSGIQTFTINNSIAPSNAKYVAIQINAYNGKGHAAFSSPMLTQTAQSTGYQPDTGNVLSSGQVILDTDGTLTTTYSGITQEPDNYYHAWQLTSGTLSIGEGYITSSAHGNKSVNGSVTMVADVKGTMSAGYVKFSNAGLSRTYMDSSEITVSNGTSNDVIVLNDEGLYVNSGGGKFKQLIVGASQHTINSVDGADIAFEESVGNSNAFVRLKAAGFDIGSLASIKKNIQPLTNSGSVVSSTDLLTYQYSLNGNAKGTRMGPVIDDVNTAKKYFVSPEIVTPDGTGIDTTKATFYGWSAIKALQRENENLQIRLRKLEIEGA